MYPFFLILTSILSIILAPHSFSAANDLRYLNCSRSFQCGGLADIGFPFWGSTRPEYCGRPGFELTCAGNSPEITISSTNYRVLEINFTSQTLSVSRSNYLCPTNLTNTTLDHTPFNYTSDTGSLLVSYGCSNASSSDSSGGWLRFTCGANRTYGSGYLTNTSASDVELLGPCNESAVLPMYRSGIRSIRSNWGSTDNFVRALNEGFGLNWLAETEPCNNCLRSGGHCGSDLSLNFTQFICYCPDRPTCRRSKPLVNPAAWSIPLGFGLAAAIVVSIWYYRGRESRKENKQIMNFLTRNDALAPRRYTYKEIKKMTDSFKDKLGQGGYGSVYKGKLPDGRLVAVKVLNVGKGGAEGFISEVGSISRTSHVNVVTFLGHCFNKTKRVLIYEFMPNGSLDKYIGDFGVLRNDDQVLGWGTLYKIAVGIARGLEYLHLGCNTRIVHFDIKPHNILLDENFCPKISDFGLAKFSEGKENINVSMASARGTIGYIAPEVFNRNLGVVSHKSDVYSYGMMVLKMVGDKTNSFTEVGDSQMSELYFPDGVYKFLEQRNDTNPQVHTAEDDEESYIIRKLSIVGLWSIQTNPSDRPTISQVVEMLQGSIQSLEMPPKSFVPSYRQLPLNFSSVESESSYMV